MNVSFDSSQIELKIEPVDPTYENEYDNIFESQDHENFTGIKQEPTDIPVKVELDQSNHEEDNVSHINVSVKLEPCNDAASLVSENVTYNHESSDDDEYVPSTTKKEKEEVQKFIYIKNGYISVNAKQLLQKRKKALGKKYSEEITRNIEVVTISEEERALEHQSLLDGRRHLNHVCEPCALGFVVENAYKMHMKLHAPESGEHECDICFVRKKTADALDAHRLRHYRRYRCALCRLQMRDKDTVGGHVMKEHMGTAFTCTHCGKDFRRRHYLKRHVDQVHWAPKPDEDDRTTSDRTIANQPDDTMNPTDTPLSKSDASEAQHATSVTPPERTKTKAQKQREYRQSLAATRTPEQVMAARRSNLERQRNCRLRKAAKSS